MARKSRGCSLSPEGTASCIPSGPLEIDESNLVEMEGGLFELTLGLQLTPFIGLRVTATVEPHVGGDEQILSYAPWDGLSYAWILSLANWDGQTVDLVVRVFDDCGTERILTRWSDLVITA